MAISTKGRSTTSVRRGDPRQHDRPTVTNSSSRQRKWRREPFMTPRWRRYSRAGELLDAIVVRVRDVDVPTPVRGHALGVPELPIARAIAAPHGEDVAVRVELLDAVVVSVRDVDVPAPVGRHAVGEVELAVVRAGAPPRREEGSVPIVLLDAVVVPVCDIDVPAPVGRHADGVVEIAVPRARL